MLLRPLKRRRTNFNGNRIGIQDLPNEILYKIFSWLEIQDMQQNVALVCHRFLQLSRIEGLVTDWTMDISCAICQKIPNHKSRMIKRIVTESNLRKIQNLVKFHPKCKLELLCNEEFDDGSSFLPWDRMGLFQSTEFFNYVFSVETLFFQEIRSMRSMNSLFDSIIEFPNLKSLEISFEDDHEEWWNFSSTTRFSIHDAPTKFWNKFPNLTSLKITSNFEGCVSSNCMKIRKLKVLSIIVLIGCNRIYKQHLQDFP